MIENQGYFDPKLLAVYGLSGKRDNDDTIGRFGSGVKISVAHMLRNNIDFRVFTNTEEIRYSFAKEKFFHSSDNIETNLIYMNGQPTGLSLDMVPDWQLWFNMREIWANALDESEPYMCLVNEDEIQPKEGYTRWFLEYKPYKEIFDNWHWYWHEGAKNYDTWKSPTGKVRLYKQGFLAFEIDQTGDCYNLDDMILTELRVMASGYNYKFDLTYYAPQFSEEMREQILTACIQHNTDHFLWEQHGGYHSIVAKHILDCVTENVYFFTRQQIGSAIFQKQSFPEQDYLLVPDTIHESIINRGHENRCFWGRNNSIGEYLESNSLEFSEGILLIQEACELLEEQGLCQDLSKYPIHFYRFNTATALAMAYQNDKGNKEILLSDKLLMDENLHVRKYAAIIYEEYLHHEHGFEDESRSFQDFLINKIMTLSRVYHKLRTGES